MNKGRGYMFKPDQHFYKVVGLFFAHNLPHRTEARPLFMWSIPHKVWSCNQDIRRFAFHVFFSPLWWITCKL